MSEAQNFGQSMGDRREKQRAGERFANYIGTILGLTFGEYYFAVLLIQRYFDEFCSLGMVLQENKIDHLLPGSVPLPLSHLNKIGVRARHLSCIMCTLGIFPVSSYPSCDFWHVEQAGQRSWPGYARAT